MFEQALMEVSEIPIRMARRSYAFVDLRQMYVTPRDFFLGQRLKHHPGSVTATDREDKATALGHRGSSLSSNKRGRFSRNRFSICKHFDFHGSISFFG